MPNVYRGKKTVGCFNTTRTSRTLHIALNSLEWDSAIRGLHEGHRISICSPGGRKAEQMSSRQGSSLPKVFVTLSVVPFTKLWS